MPLCDFLLAAEYEDAMLASADPLADGWRGFRLDQVDAGVLSVLGGVLRADEAPAIDAFEWTLLGVADPDDGPWVYRFPSDLRVLLRAHDGPFEGLARRWHRSHELTRACNLPVLEDQLRQIRAWLDEPTLLYWSMA